MAGRSLFAHRTGAISAKLKTLAEFVQGRELLNKGKCGLAEMELKRALQILDNSKETDEASFAVLMTDIARAQLGQSKSSPAQLTLETIVHKTTAADLRWASIRNLLSHYLSTAPSQAANLCKLLLTDATIQGTWRDEVRFILGTAMMLQREDVGKAVEVLNQQFDAELRPFVKHNLGCALWWSVTAYGRNMENGTESTLNPAVSSLFSAISGLENVPEVTESLPLTSPYTGHSLSTLACIYLTYHNNTQASKWLKLSLKSHQKHSPELTSAPLIRLAALLRREKAFLHAEGMLQYAIDQLVKAAPSYDLVLALREFAATIQSNPKRERESHQYLSQATEMENKLHPWANLACYLHLPTLQSL